MNNRKIELERIFESLCSGHDVFPFFDQLLHPDDAHLILVPSEILALLECQPEFHELEPGDAPRTMQFSGDYGSLANLIIYRSSFDENYYVIAPKK